jgi:hypothetical protein
MTWKPETRAAKNFEKIQKQIKSLEALASLLEKNPRVAGRYLVTKDYADVVLKYDDLFVIRPIWRSAVALQVERLQADDSDYESREQRTVHSDITPLLPHEVDSLLKKLEIDLDPYPE